MGFAVGIGRHVADHHLRLQPPAGQVLEEAPHAVLVVGPDQGEADGQVGQGVGGHEQGVSARAQFIDAQLVAGTILAPNGRIFSSNVHKTIGAFWGYTVSVNGDGSFLSDTSGVPLAYADFKQLRSWKEE